MELIKLNERNHIKCLVQPTKLTNLKSGQKRGGRFYFNFGERALLLKWKEALINLSKNDFLIDASVGTIVGLFLWRN